MKLAVKRTTPEASSVKVKVETANLLKEVHKHHVLGIFAGTKQLLNTLSDNQPSPKCSWRHQRDFFCLRFLWESLVSMNLDKTTTAALKKIPVVKHEAGSQPKIQVGYNRQFMSIFCKIHNAYILLTFETQLYIASHIQAGKLCTVDPSAFKDTWKGPCQGTMHGTWMGLSAVHCMCYKTRKMLIALHLLIVSIHVTVRETVYCL